MTFARHKAQSEERAAEREAQRARNRSVLVNAPNQRVGRYGGEVRPMAPQPKIEPVRSEEYRRLVAALPCCICKMPGRSQAAHPNTGKGMGTKTDDRLCFPACGPRYDGHCGCHAALDQGALFPKAVRRELEPAWGADTRRAILAAGDWPKNLPLWEAQS